MRVASLLPSATELVAALGEADRLVLRSHECDGPPDVTGLPYATRPRYPTDGSSRRIDEGVRAVVEEGLSVYRVDADVLRGARPDVILTQDHCAVCAVSEAELREAAARVLDPPPRIVSLAPTTLEGILGDVARVAGVLGVPGRGEAVVARLREGIARVEEAVRGRPRPGVVTVEWLDPLMTAGNWAPELVELAGGRDLLGTPGAHSPVLEWDRVREAEPEAIVVFPCGFSLERTRDEVGLLTGRPGWSDLPAVRAGRVFLADGHRHLNRPGPRIVESLEILAEMLHPEAASFGHRGEGWEPLGAAGSGRSASP